MKKNRWFSRWFIPPAVAVEIILVLVIGFTMAYFNDPETSTANTVTAWTSSQWVQTTQAHFNAGVLTNVDTSSSPGDVILAISPGKITDTFNNETKIASKSNLLVSGGQVKLTGGGSTSTTLQPSTADSYIMQNDPNKNCGTENLMWVDSKVGNENWRSFVRFDLSSIPAGSTISSATLSLRMKDAPGASRALELQRVSASWGESSITWNNQPGVSGSAVTTSTGTSPEVWLTWNVTADVRDFIQYQSATNYGWRTKDQTENSSTEYKESFYTRDETSQTTRRPRLSINYTSPYNSPGTLTSTNLLSGQTVDSIDSFDYTASAILLGTNLKVQFSQDNANWYNSAGNAGGWDTLSQGTHSIDLGGLGWSGPNFYYKAEFTSDGSGTPTLDEISVTFSGVGWYDTDWQYRRAITIDHTKVQNVANPSTTYANFSVLVYATGLSNIKANGADIRFTSSDGVTELPREIESYSGGTLYAWVKVTLTKDSSDSSDDVIYMYYGNAAATEPAPDSAYGSQNVWDTNYKLVTHMKDVPDTSHVADSTSNNNAGTKRGAGEPAVTASGEIYDAQTFDATNDRIGASSAASVDNIFASGGTAEAWIYPTAWGEGSLGRVFDKGGTAGWSFYVDNINGTNVLTFYHGATFGDGVWLTPNYSITLNQWQHVAVAFNKSSISNNPTIYINGQSKSLTEAQNPSGSYISDAAENVNIGNRPAEDRTFAGRIDESRLSTTIRPAGWIGTEYNNQSSPSTFCSLGGEVGQYVSSGTIASQVLDTTVTGSRWDGLVWDRTLPSGTSITFEVRASDISFPSNNTTPSWTSVGGTSPVISGLPSGRYKQWRATLTTNGSQTSTPILSEVRVYYYGN